MKRRNFIKSSIALSSVIAQNTEIVQQPTNLKVIVLNTNWGWKGSLDEFLKNSKEAGYDGIEVWWTSDTQKTKILFDALQKYEMQVGFLAGSGKSDFIQHKAEFEKAVFEASSSLTQKPLFINCHSGKDYFSYEQNSELVQYTLEQSAKAALPIYHETHRGRMCYSLPITIELLKRNPGMKLALDASHWTNVHESLLQDQKESLSLALAQTGHIHARIGHQEGPQVNDPRAPEWKNTLDIFLGWWDTVVNNQEAAGKKEITFLTEFGPPSYLPTLPYTQLPVADQWGINEYMLGVIRGRYGK
jgi:sugar phosphate isomerase/epimerase